MLDKSLPQGLRHVLVHVTLGSVFPPASDSEDDIALLRAANRAMQRKAQGAEDAFLFVLVGHHNFTTVNEAVSAFGFPKATVICIEYDGDVSNEDAVFDTFEVARAVEKWLDLEHSGAVAAFGKDYAETEFWWSGVERCDYAFAWPFDDGDFADALPSAHRSKAATWLAILAIAVDLDAVADSTLNELGRQQAAVWAATLCEWLHGFEAASGNGFNSVESQYSQILMPSDFYLGFELARLSRSDMETACDENDADVDDLQTAALKAVTAEKRGELRAALSDFFGGDGGLYWALHSTIWPAFFKSIGDALEGELGGSDFEDLARLDAPWRFVSEGWSVEADDY